MRPRHLNFALLIVILVSFSVAMPAQYPLTNAASTTPVVPRVLYFSGSNGLSFNSPQGTSPSLQNLTTTSPTIQFNSGTTRLFFSVPVTGPIGFTIWLMSNKNTTVSLRLSLIGGGGINATDQVLPAVTPRLTNYTFSYSPAFDFSLLFGTQIIASVSAIVPPGTNVTLAWGSKFAPSSVTIPMSGYQIVDTVDVLDRQRIHQTNFDLNTTVGNNVVLIRASIESAFGSQDILGVNLTIVDPSLHSVNGAINQSMTGPFPSSISPPYSYNFQWAYQSSLAEGSYQIRIDIFDVQNNRAFSFGGPASFVLSRQTILSRALNLVPYFGVGGGAVVAGAVYVRRRKTQKSYLVPFDYFNTLTGGELDGGTAVTIEGNTGAGKTLLTEQLMYEDLKKGRRCVYVSTGDFPSNIRTNMKGIGLDVAGYEQNGLLTFVDGYSAEAGQQSPEKFSIPSLGDLTTLGMKITSSLPQDSFKGGSLYFDSLTPLASKARPESLVSFVQSVGARVKGMGGKAFFTLGPSVDSIVHKQLEEMADCVVQMEAFEESGVRKSRLRIAKYRARRHQQGWVIYTIEDSKGIIFYSKKPRR